MNNMPRYLLFFCHGKTEATFVNEIVRKYIELKFEEFFGAESGYYKNEGENPDIIIAEKWNGEIYLSVNSFDSDIEQFISAEERRKDLSKRTEIVSISIIDILENESEDPYKRERVLQNHKEIIEEIAKNYGITTDNSHLYYFEEKIESCLEDFHGKVISRNAPKPLKMSQWVSQSIKEIWENYGDLTSILVKELISKSKNTNIIDLFVLIDEWFNSLEN